MSPDDYVAVVTAMDLPTPAASEWKQSIEQRIMSCGVAAGQICVSYQEDLQDFEVVISGLGADVDPSTFTCLARAERDGIIIVLDTIEGWKALRAAYRAEFAETDRAAGEERARSWLQKRGLFESRPVFDPQQQTRAQYVQTLERFCSLPEGSLRPGSLSSLTNPTNSLVHDNIICLFSVLALDEAGRAVVGGLGFVGEAAKPVE